jgi:hypothetical protein
MKKQRRFSKRFEIEAEINKLKRKAKKKLVDASGFEVDAALQVAQSRLPLITEGERQHCIEQADFIRKKAARLRRSVEIINDVKLPALGRTLAAFQTETLFKGDDQAVVLQK